MAYTITRGTVSKPVKACIYGVEGVGKTTFAANWPNAVFIDIEDGSGHYDVARFPKPHEWLGIIAEVEAAAKMDEVGTLVIDTADAAEALCTAYVLTVNKKKGLEDFGYGKGYTYLGEKFADLLKALDKVVDAGKNVVLLAHAQIRKFEQPDEMGAYDRWELKLQKKCAPLVKEWCDLLLFANYKTDVLVSVDGSKTKAQGGKKRVMYATHTATWDAKNRLGLPDEMPFDFAAIADKIPSGLASIAEDAAEARAGVESGATPMKKLKELTDEASQIASELTAKEISLEFEEVTPPEFQQLHQLMADYGVNDAQLRDAVASRKNNPYTIETQIGEYSTEFVKNTLLKHWEKIVETVRNRELYAEDIPF